MKKMNVDEVEEVEEEETSPESSDLEFIDSTSSESEEDMPPSYSEEEDQDNAPPPSYDSLFKSSPALSSEDFLYELNAVEKKIKALEVVFTGTCFRVHDWKPNVVLVVPSTSELRDLHEEPGNPVSPQEGSDEKQPEDFKPSDVGKEQEISSNDCKGSTDDPVDDGKSSQQDGVAETNPVDVENREKLGGAAEYDPVDVEGCKHHASTAETDTVNAENRKKLGDAAGYDPVDVEDIKQHADAVETDPVVDAESRNQQDFEAENDNFATANFNHKKDD